MTPINPPGRETQQIPVIRLHEHRARAAWDAYAALRRTEKTEPALRDNAVWNRLVSDAQSAFQQAFEAMP